MQNQYNFDIYLEHENGSKIYIDSKALYCYFEFWNGSEGGGGLWFDRTKEGKLELQDYDGVFGLSKTFLNMLLKEGIVLRLI